MTLGAVVRDGYPRFTTQGIADIGRAAPVKLIAVENDGCQRYFNIAGGVTFGSDVDRRKGGFFSLRSRREGDKQRERYGILAKQGHDNSSKDDWLAMAGWSGLIFKS